MESPWTLAPLATAREVARCLPGARSELIVGVNALTRHLERGTARLACVCGDDAEPRDVVASAVDVCLRTRVPVACLPRGSSAILARSLGLKRCLALGVVTRDDDGDDGGAERDARGAALEDLVAAVYRDRARPADAAAAKRAKRTHLFLPPGADAPAAEAERRLR